MIEEIGEVEWRGHLGTVLIKAIEWEEPKKVLRGGVAKSGALPIQAQLLNDQLTDLNNEISAIDDQIRAIDSATDKGEAPNQSKLDRLAQQRNALAAKRAQTQSALAATLADPLNKSFTPDQPKDKVSQNSVSTQKPTKTPKPDPYASGSAGAPNANP